MSRDMKIHEAKLLLFAYLKQEDVAKAQKQFETVIALIKGVE